MENLRLLIVDDEKNIRLTVSHALEPLGYDIETAMNGEDALKKLEAGPEYELMLLDLKMPGMDGIEVLRHIAEHYPDTQVIIFSAHGTVDNAVEAMKLGAVDFIQKPFTPQEIRDVVTNVFERGWVDEERGLDYETHVNLARHYASKRRMTTAVEHARKAIGIDPSRAEAFNVLGVLLELRGDRTEAKKNYRVALDLDPTYQPAQENLSRAVSSPRSGRLPNLG